MVSFRIERRLLPREVSLEEVANAINKTVDNPSWAKATDNGTVLLGACANKDFYNLFVGLLVLFQASNPNAGYIDFSFCSAGVTIRLNSSERRVLLDFIESLPKNFEKLTIEVSIDSATGVKKPLDTLT